MKSIVITSGKGGVGKTTVTACLGRAIAECGARVVLMDADFGLNNLDVVLGVESRVVYDVADVIDNRCRVRQALVEIDRNLFLLPSAHGYLSEKVNAQNLRLILTNLANTFDFALVDCPAGIEAGFRRAVAACDSAIVVTTPHLSALRDANKVVNLLTSYKMPSSLIVNRMRGDLAKSGKIPSLNEISTVLKIDIVGGVPETDVVYDFSNMPIKPFERIAKRLIYGVDSVVDPVSEYKGVRGFFKRRMNKSRKGD